MLPAFTLTSCATTLAALTLFGLLGLGVSFAQYAHRQRLLRLSERPILPRWEWLQLFPHAATDLDLECLESAVELIALQIGVHPTQLLPGDRFDRELSADSFFQCECGHRDFAKFFAEDFGADESELRRAETLGEMLTLVCRRGSESATFWRSNFAA